MWKWALCFYIESLIISLPHPQLCRGGRAARHCWIDAVCWGERRSPPEVHEIWCTERMHGFFFFSCLSHYLVCLLKVCLFPFLADIYFGNNLQGQMDPEGMTELMQHIYFSPLKGFGSPPPCFHLLWCAGGNPAAFLNRALCKQFGLQQLAALRGFIQSWCSS